MSTHRTRNTVTRSALTAAVAGIAIFGTLDTAEAASPSTAEPEPVLTESTTTPPLDVADIEYEYVCNGCSITTASQPASEQPAHSPRRVGSVATWSQRVETMR